MGPNEGRDTRAGSLRFGRSRRIAYGLFLLIATLILLGKLIPWNTPPEGEPKRPRVPEPAALTESVVPDPPPAEREVPGTPAPANAEPRPSRVEPVSVDLKIRGIVVFNEAPVAGARVRCLDSTGTHIAGAFGVRTDEAGAFTINASNQTAYPVSLRAMKAGYRQTVLRLDSAASEIVLTLDKGLSISGVVRDEAGNPVRAGVHAIRLDTNGRVVAGRGIGLVGLCDSEGRFEVWGLEAGRYRIAYAGKRHVLLPTSSADCMAGAEGVEIVVERACALELTLWDSATRGPAKGKFTVHLTDRSANFRRIQTTSHRVRISAVRQGVYSLRVSALRYKTWLLQNIRLDRLEEKESLEVHLERRGNWGPGTVAVGLEWHEELAEKSGRPRLWVRLVRASSDAEPTHWPPKEFAPVDELKLPKTLAGEYRLYAWTRDDRWVARPVLIKVRANETVRAAMILERAGSLLPKLEASSVLRNREKVALELFDERGVRLSVAWLDCIPLSVSRLGPLPGGRVTVVVLSGDSRILSVDTRVVPGESTVVHLR